MWHPAQSQGRGFRELRTGLFESSHPHSTRAFVSSETLSPEKRKGLDVDAAVGPENAAWV